MQGIENLGGTFKAWKDNWKKTAKVLAKDKGIPHNKVLDGEGLFIGYIINSYNQYSKKPIKRNEEWVVQPTSLRRPKYQLLRDSLIDNWPHTPLVVHTPEKSEVVLYYTPQYTF